jgi:hypothetical protein
MSEKSISEMPLSNTSCSNDVGCCMRLSLITQWHAHYRSAYLICEISSRAFERDRRFGMIFSMKIFYHTFFTWKIDLLQFQLFVVLAGDTI